MDDTSAALVGAAGSVTFVEIFLRLNTLARIRTLLDLYRRSWNVVRSSRISDHWKERVLPRYAGRILGNAGLIILQLGAALAVLVATALVVALAIGSPDAASGDIFTGWAFNVAALVIGIGYASWRRRWLR